MYSDETRNKIKQFLENQEQTILTLKYEDYSYNTTYYKLRFGQFQFIYYLTYHSYPTFGNNSILCGIIDTATNKKYFLSYEIRKSFEYSHIGQLDYIKQDEVSSWYNADIDKAYEELAKTITEEKIPQAYEIEQMQRNAQENYYYGNREESYYYPTQVDLDRLLSYIANPIKEIQEEMERRESSTYTQSRPSERIKYQNLQRRISDEELNKIERLDKYKYLRKAKAIKEACCDRKQVTVYYKSMTKDEILVGKANTSIFSHMPYSTEDKMHFGNWDLEKQFRDKILKTDGREYDDLYIKNILKIEYRGKTIYEDKENN